MEPTDDYDNKLPVEFAGNNAPDVLWDCDTLVSKFASRGGLYDLDNFIGKDPSFPKDDFFPVLLDLCSYKGKLYSLPRELGTLIIYYNEDAFTKAGVPFPKSDWTWQDFLDAAKKLTIKDKDGAVQQYGFVSGPTWWATWAPWVWQAGGDFTNADYTKALLNTPEAKDGIQFYYDLYKQGVMPSRIGMTVSEMQLFQGGKAAMLLHCAAAVPDVRKSNGFKWDCVELPKGKYTATTTGTSAYGIYAKTKHPEEAWKFLKFITTGEGARIHMADFGMVPALQSLAKTTEFLNDAPPKNREAMVDIKGGRVPPFMTPSYNKLCDVVNNGLDRIFLGQQSVSDACDQMNAEIQAILDEEQ